MSPSKFRTIVNDEKKLLTDLCEKWEKVLTISSEEEPKDEPVSSRTRSKTQQAEEGETNTDSKAANQQQKPGVIQDEELIGLVRATTGQGRMLLGQRFVQFEKLIDDAENKTSEKPIGDDDLQGFWDMIGFQVDDMKEKFQLLEKAEANDWKLPDEKQVPDEPKPVAATAKAKTSKPATSGTAATNRTKKPAGGGGGIRDFIAQKRREAAAQKQQQDGECKLCAVSVDTNED